MASTVAFTGCIDAQQNTLPPIEQTWRHAVEPEQLARIARVWRLADKLDPGVCDEAIPPHAFDRATTELDIAFGHDPLLVSHGLQIGIVVDEHLVAPGQGDFMIRGLLGADYVMFRRRDWL